MMFFANLAWTQWIAVPCWCWRAQAWRSRRWPMPGARRACRTKMSSPFSLVQSLECKVQKQIMGTSYDLQFGEAICTENATLDWLDALQQQNLSLEDDDAAHIICWMPRALTEFHHRKKSHNTFKRQTNNRVEDEVSNPRYTRSCGPFGQLWRWAKQREHTARVMTSFTYHLSGASVLWLGTTSKVLRLLWSGIPYCFVECWLVCLEIGITWDSLSPEEARLKRTFRRLHWACVLDANRIESSIWLAKKT